MSAPACNSMKPGHAYCAGHDECQLPAYARPDFEKQGREAFATGARRIVPRSILVDHGVGPARAWYRGWDAANLAAPLPECDNCGDLGPVSTTDVGRFCDQACADAYSLR